MQAAAQQPTAQQPAQPQLVDETTTLQPPEQQLAEQIAPAKAEPTSDEPSEQPVQDIGAVRYQARNLLMQASRSGELSGVLQTQAPRRQSAVQQATQEETAQGVDALRQEARRVLMEASLSGQLSDAVQALPSQQAAAPNEPAQEQPAQDLDMVRQQARNLLMQAGVSGQLSEALQAVASRQPLEQFVQEQPSKNVDMLRNQARDVLVEASLSGQLSEAMQELELQRQPVALKEVANDQPLEAQLADDGVEHARLEARNLLIEASLSGRLADALREACAAVDVVVSQSPVEQPAEGADILQRALDEPEEPQLLDQAPTDLEPLRVRVKDLLTEASLTGDLVTALQGSAPRLSLAAEETTTEQEEIELLRYEAKSTLMQASLSGQLATELRAVTTDEEPAAHAVLAAPEEEAPTAPEEDLATQQSVEQAEGNIEVLRQAAKNALMQASLSGQLAIELRAALADEELATLELLIAAKEEVPTAPEEYLAKQQSVEQAEGNVEVLRQAAKNALMQASLSGQLAIELRAVVADEEPATLAVLVVPEEEAPTAPEGDLATQQSVEQETTTEQPVQRFQKDVEVLCREARSTLIQASRSGQLADALREMGEDRTAPQEPFALEEALPSAPEEETAGLTQEQLEDAKSKARSALLAAFLPSTEDAIEDDSKEAKTEPLLSSTETEDVKALVRKALESAARDKDAATLEVKEMKENARAVLERAVSIEEEEKTAIKEAEEEAAFKEKVWNALGVALSSADDSEVPAPSPQETDELKAVKLKAFNALLALSVEPPKPPHEVDGVEATTEQVDVEHSLEEDELEIAKEKARRVFSVALFSGEDLAGDVATGTAEGDVALQPTESLVDVAAEPSLGAEQMEALKERSRKALSVALFNDEAESFFATAFKPSDEELVAQEEVPLVVAEDVVPAVPEELAEPMAAALAASEAALPAAPQEFLVPEKAAPTVPEELVVALKEGAVFEVPKMEIPAELAVPREVASLAAESAAAPAPLAPAAAASILEPEAHPAAPAAAVATAPAPVAPSAIKPSLPASAPTQEAVAAEIATAAALRTRLASSKEQLTEYNAILKEEVSLLNEDLATLIAKRDALKKQRASRAS